MRSEHSVNRGAAAAPVDDKDQCSPKSASPAPTPAQRRPGTVGYLQKAFSRVPIIGSMSMSSTSETPQSRPEADNNVDGSQQFLIDFAEEICGLVNCADSRIEQIELKRSEDEDILDNLRSDMSRIERAVVAMVKEGAVC